MRSNETQEAIKELIGRIPKGTHLTAPEVFEQAKQIGLNVSLSTIYRILHRLKTKGNLTTVAGDRSIRYETADKGPQHDHLICLSCSKTIEFSDELIRGFGKTVAERKGFIYKASRFDILGCCDICLNKDSSRQLFEVNHSFLTSQQNLEEASSFLNNALLLTDARKPLKAIDDATNALDKLKEALVQLENALSSIHRNFEDLSNI